MEHVTVVAVKNIDPIFSASIRPAMVDTILNKPPNQAHQGTSAALLWPNPASRVKGSMINSAIRAVPYTHSAANKG
jgi:hypothetical protein